MDGPWQSNHWGEPQPQWGQQPAPQHEQWQHNGHQSYDTGPQIPHHEQQMNWGPPETNAHQAYHQANPNTYMQSNNQGPHPYNTEHYQPQFVQHRIGTDYHSEHGLPPQASPHHGGNFPGHYAPEPRHRHPLLSNPAQANPYLNVGMPSKPRGYVPARARSPVKPKTKHPNKVWTSPAVASAQKRAPGTIIRNGTTGKLTTLPVQSSTKSPGKPATPASTKPAPPAKGPAKPPPAGQKTEQGKATEDTVSLATKEPAPAPAKGTKGASAATASTPQSTPSAPTQGAGTKPAAPKDVHPNSVDAAGKPTPNAQQPTQKPSAPATVQARPVTPKPSTGASTPGGSAPNTQPLAGKGVIRLPFDPPGRGGAPTRPTQTNTGRPPAPRPQASTPSKHPATTTNRPPAPTTTQQSKPTQPPESQGVRPPARTNAQQQAASVPAMPANVGYSNGGADDLQREMAWAKILAHREKLPPIDSTVSAEQLLAEAREIQQRNKTRVSATEEPPQKKQRTTLQKERPIEVGRDAARNEGIFLSCTDAVVRLQEQGQTAWTTMDPSSVCIYRNPQSGIWFFSAAGDNGYQVHISMDGDMSSRLHSEQSGTAVFHVPRTSDWPEGAEERPHGGCSFAVRFPTTDLAACFEFVRLFDIAAAEFRIRAREGFKNLEPPKPKPNKFAPKKVVTARSVPSVEQQQPTQRPNQQPTQRPNQQPTQQPREPSQDADTANQQQPPLVPALLTGTNREVLEEAQRQLAIKKILVASEEGRRAVEHGLGLCARLGLCLRKIERVQVASRGGALDAEVQDYLVQEARELRKDLIGAMAAVAAACAERDDLVVAEEPTRVSNKRSHDGSP